MAGASGTSNFTEIKEASNSIEAAEEQEEITNYEPSLNENIDEQQDERAARFLEALSQNDRDKVAELCEKEKPVNILVIGPSCSGKSTLINALLGDTVAMTGHGAMPVTRGVICHEGEFLGIKLKVYDTVGFGDSEGSSGQSIVKKIADKNRFDLMLICLRLDERPDRLDKEMFLVLGAMVKEAIWKRSIVVLTFANMFVQLKSVKEQGPREAIDEKIEEFRQYVHRHLSRRVSQETLSNIPFCIAGEDGVEKIIDVDDELEWLAELWADCVNRCSDEARPLLKALADFRLFIAQLFRKK